VDLMQFVESLTDRTPLFAADTGARAVAECFAQRPGSCAFPVTDGSGAVTGLVERAAVARAASDGQANRGVGALMRRAPLMVDSALTVREAIDIVLAHTDRPEAFIVMDGEQCLGVCTLPALIQALLDTPKPRTAEFDEAVTEEVQRLYGALEAECRIQVQGLMAMTDRLERQPLGPDALAQVYSIRATGEALLRLAGDANDLMRARQGRIELNTKPQSLRALIDRVQSRWVARAEDNGVGLLISYDGDPDLSALIDADRLTQVFDSLVDNALRYTRRGSIEVGLRARVDEGQVRLEGRVRDTGAELATKMAEAFEADALTGEGLSLPLSLARGVLAGMNGSLHAEANAGQGATMVFQLVADAVEEPAPEAEEKPASGAAHVLVVDDNATNRMVAEALCEMFDCTSETAEDGVEAVEAARTGRFDLILMDIKMPRMDGIAAARAIRSLEGPEAMTPIVALTANVDPEDARSYLAAGMCCVVEKPIKPDRLLQAINVALAESQTGSEDGGRIAAA
jgi:CheY-like chemotaxis protein